jgi:predicted ribosome quality control (RQC) complex YloA/Tae2 family protein
VLSLCELRRAADIVNAAFAGHRVERFVEPRPGKLAISLYGRGGADASGGKRVLSFCCDPEVARIAEVEALPKAPQNPPAFVAYLRAHLSRARVLGAGLIGEDRQLAVHFEAKAGRFDLVLSILGNRSNLYILDRDGVIVAAQRAPADTRPELVLGAHFSLPESGVPKPGVDRFAEVGDDAFLSAIEAHYSEREGERAELGLAKELRGLLKREEKNALRRFERIEAELAEADQATVLQQHGELLKGVLGKIQPGASEIVVTDYASGDGVTISLDPAKSPKQNLEATFKRYQKLLRRLTKAGGQVDAARVWLETVRDLRGQLDTAVESEGDATPVLEALAQRPEIARLRSKSRAAGNPSKPTSEEKSTLPARLRDLPKRLHPRRYKSRDDLEIWVGRNDEGNDHLTTRLARGNDLFFHLDGAPGSHVILKTEGLGEPPAESILDACELAVHFSKHKNAGSAEVHVVPIKQVKKPKGAKRGLVWVTGGKSIHLRREETRLKRLMDARIDDR